MSKTVPDDDERVLRGMYEHAIDADMVREVLWVVLRDELLKRRVSEE